MAVMTGPDAMPPPELQAALAQLRDIHLPAAVSAWPPAPGWWLLAALVLAAGLGAALAWRRHRRSARTAALRQVAELERAARQGRLAPAELATASAELLRRAAIARFGRAQVARLQGADWIDFLNRVAARAGPPPFAGPVAAALAQGPYAPAPEVPDAALLAAVRRWLRACA